MPTRIKAGSPRSKRVSSSPLKRRAIEFLNQRSHHMNTLARQIWETPELGLEEHRSAALLVDDLKQAGFQVETGVAGMPTAFVGTWGKGRPHIGIIAEYDAVPNCGPKKTENGHGCGHNLFGTASVSAGIALKIVLEGSGTRGTVQVLGTPAEEMVLGKVVMVKEGVFDGLDAVVSWHPGEGTHADYGTFMALDSITFEFIGESAHAMIDPQNARNALATLEMMNEGVNRLRGHVPSGTGIHYVISDGGKVPGVILPYAKSWYWIWTPTRSQTEAVTAEVKRIARGSARATGTKVKTKLVTGTYHRLPNIALGQLIEQNLQLVGAPQFSREDKALARRLGFKDPLAEWVEPSRKDYVMPVTNDNGNVSWIAPFGMFRATTRAPETPEHHWLSTIQYGSGIGMKGMQVAAKTLACTGLDLFTQPAMLSVTLAWSCLKPPSAYPPPYPSVRCFGIMWMS
jgi:aminobenzoyl-glutamate utilization protein B